MVGDVAHRNGFGDDKGFRNYYSTGCAVPHSHQTTQQGLRGYKGWPGSWGNTVHTFHLLPPPAPGTKSAARGKLFFDHMSWQIM
jgi:hypothetical protein